MALNPLRLFDWQQIQALSVDTTGGVLLLSPVSWVLLMATLEALQNFTLWTYDGLPLTEAQLQEVQEAIWQMEREMLDYDPPP